MKTQLRTKVLMVALGVSALALSTGTAKAQTEVVTATVTVQNTLTTDVVDNMDFGTIASLAAAANTASMILNPVTDGYTFSSTGGGAVIAMIDNTSVAAANITVEDGADGAAIQITIDNVTNPNYGGSNFVLGTWMTSWNGAAQQPATVSASFARNFSVAFGGGTNTLDVGATLTNVAGQTYTDGVYPGSFEVSFSY